MGVYRCDKLATMVSRTKVQRLTSLGEKGTEKLEFSLQSFGQFPEGSTLIFEDTEFPSSSVDKPMVASTPKICRFDRSRIVTGRQCG